MKKTYINPEMQVVEINTPVLLTGSLPVSSETITGSEMLAPEMLDLSDLVPGIPSYVFE